VLLLVAISHNLLRWLTLSAGPSALEQVI